MAWMSSKVRPAEIASKVAASSSPIVTKAEVLLEVEYDIWPERWPSGTHPIAIETRTDDRVHLPPIRCGADATADAGNDIPERSNKWIEVLRWRLEVKGQ